MNEMTKLCILLYLSPVIYGAIELNCGTTSPAYPSSMTCSCINTNGNGVEWWLGMTPISECFFSVGCSPKPSGYTFLFNQTELVFRMTVNPYNYSECQQFTCKDFSDTSIQHSQTPSTIEFDSTMPKSITEPDSNYTSGAISVTTSCISDHADLIANWSLVVDGSAETYIPDQDTVIENLDTTSCVHCNSESASTLTIGFRHEEAVGSDTREGYFRLELYHPNFPSDPLVLNTSNVYNVKVSGDFDGSNGNGINSLYIFLSVLGGVVCIVIIILVTCINGKPKPVKGFRVKNVTHSSITVTWQTYSKCFCQAKYILKCSENETVVSMDMIEYEFVNLLEGTMYRLDIHEKTFIGISGKQSTLKVRTKGKPYEPTDFNVASGGIKEKSITVQWEQGYDGGHPQTFILTYLKMKVEVHDRKGEKFLQHTFNNLLGGTYYDFTIRAENEIGSSTEVGPLHLRTNGKPDEPIDFKDASNSISETSITVQWEPGYDGGHPQTFILTYLTTKVEKHDRKGEKFLQHTFNNLLGGTYYDFKIHAKNKRGSSTEVGPLRLRTNGKPDPPTEFKVASKGVNKASIEVEWKRGLDGGFPQTFIITHSQNEKEVESRVPDDKESSLLRYTLKGLKQATYYKLQIRAVNEKGPSQQLIPLNVRTNGPPDPPTNFSVADSGVTETSIRVGWLQGSNGGYKQTFILTCSENGKDNCIQISETENHAMQYVWTNLSEATYYQISLAASNKEGLSPRLDPIHVRTFGRPDPPTGLCVVKDGVTKSSIGVTWEPGFDGGFPQTFILKCFKNDKVLQTAEKPDKKEQYNQYIFEGLSVCTAYQLQILSKNDKGTSEPSPLVPVRTKGFPHEN